MIGRVVMLLCLGELLLLSSVRKLLHGDAHMCPAHAPWWLASHCQTVSGLSAGLAVSAAHVRRSGNRIRKDSLTSQRSDGMHVGILLFGIASRAHSIAIGTPTEYARGTGRDS